MKIVYKYSGSLLLFVIFNLKIVAPSFSIYCFNEKVPAEQQQEKSTEEKSAEKIFSYSVEVADITTMQSDLYVPGTSLSTFFLNEPSFLPVQYCAIPTPPPWAKS